MLKLYLQNNISYRQFIEGSDIAIILVTLTSARVCDVNDSVRVYSKEGLAWHEAPAMGAARFSGASAVLDGLIYAFGGYGTGNTHLATMERFSAERGAWVVDREVEPEYSQHPSGYLKRMR